MAFPPVITRLSEVDGVSLISLADVLKLPEAEINSRFAAIQLNPSTNVTLNRRADIHLLVAEEFQKTEKMRYSSLKAAIGKQYKIVDESLISTHLLRAVYEKAAKAAKEAKDDIREKTEMHQMFERIVGYALQAGVSDIHVEKRRDHAQIRMRKHGQMIDYSELGPEDCTKLISAVYMTIAENKQVTYNERKYQSASVNMTLDRLELMLRYQSLPVYPDGFDVVLRVLPLGSDDEEYVPLEKLGYELSQKSELIDIISKPVGALIIAGTTGSGKSTTLKNLLMWINASREYRCKIYTVEDPPEYRIPRVSQIPVIRNDKDKAGGGSAPVSPFYEPLVATMRADPDVLMIGEIRDIYTGDGLKKATQSGHQVLTTVHATSALGVLERLADFGIPPSVMGNPEFLNGSVYQKLLPVLCPECSIPYPGLSGHDFSGSFSSLQDPVPLPDLDGDAVMRGREEATRARLVHVFESCPDVLPNIKIRGDASECKRCGGMGVVGRTVCAEVVAPDFALLKCFRTQKSIEAYEYWRSLSDGDPISLNMRGKTALEHAILKVSTGLVSPHDVEEVFGPIDGAERALSQMRSEREQEESRKNPEQYRAMLAAQVSSAPVSARASPAVPSSMDGDQILDWTGFDTGDE